MPVLQWLDDSLFSISTIACVSNFYGEFYAELFDLRGVVCVFAVLFLIFIGDFFLLSFQINIFVICVVCRQHVDMGDGRS